MEHRFETAKELLDALTPWSQRVLLKGYIFRGHANSDYELVPTSLREKSKASIWDYSLAYADITGSGTDNDFAQAFVEFQLIRDFYREADARGLHVPISERLRNKLYHKVDFRTMSTWANGEKWLPEDMLEVAALAQHYGVSTRLLDWTYDPFVAAYFASKPPLGIEGDLCIWGLDVGAIGALESIASYFPLKIVTPHYSGNPNLAAQSGLFTHWGHKIPGLREISNGEIKELPPVDRRPLDVILSEYIGPGIAVEGKALFVKLVLPKSQALDLARLLREFGYGPAKLFPGYEGVAMELQERPLLKKLKI